MTYETADGKKIVVDDMSAEVRDFLKRIQTIADDETKTVDDLILCIYSTDNPIMDTNFIPGRAMVTEIVFNNPVYSVMNDIIYRKQLAKRGQTIDDVYKSYTVSVQGAAAKLSMTPAGIRQAINAKKLDAIRQNGQWWIRPASIDGYRVSNRGKHLKRGKPSVVAKVGSEPGMSFSIKVTPGTLLEENESGERCFPGDWTEAIIKTTIKSDQGNSVRAYVIQPGPHTDEIHLGTRYVRGAFDVVRKINNPREANETWKNFGKAKTS
jgi:hypothetical protein